MTGPIESSLPMRDKRKKKRSFNQGQDDDFITHFNDTLLAQESLELIINRYMATPCHGFVTEKKDNKSGDLTEILEISFPFSFLPSEIASKKFCNSFFIFNFHNRFHFY